MCGRYSLTADPSLVQQELGLAALPEHHARYNIAPTQAALVVTAAHPRVAQLARWGLIPPWAKDAHLGASLINARSETLEEKPAFKEALHHRRCLVPADGFYEWPGGQPVHIALAKRAIFTFAGLWESWRSPDGVQVTSFTIVTTEASQALATVHSRMPVLLAPENRHAWLEGTVSSALALLQPWAGGPLQVTEVSDAVGSVSHDGPECLSPPTHRQLSLL